MTWEVFTLRCRTAAIAVLFVAAAHGADFHSVKTVYLLPMANGMDQYLAARLVNGGVVQVIADPQKAEAVITDHVGDSFEKSLDDLYGSAPVAKDDNGSTPPQTRMGGGQRSRGTFFLVDRKTREILWSDEETPRGTSVLDTRRTAARVADHLAKALNGDKALNGEKSVKTK